MAFLNSPEPENKGGGYVEQIFKEIVSLVLQIISFQVLVQREKMVMQEDRYQGRRENLGEVTHISNRMITLPAEQMTLVTIALKNTMVFGETFDLNADILRKFQRNLHDTRGSRTRTWERKQSRRCVDFPKWVNIFAVFLDFFLISATNSVMD